MKRTVAFAAFLLVFASSVLAQSADEAAVLKNMDALHKAIMTVDKAQLEALTWPELSYGHSAGRVEDKAQFVDALMTKKSVVPKIEITKVTTKVAGDIITLRGHMGGISSSGGKDVPLDLQLIMTWQKRGGEWKLLSRQAFKI